MRIESITIKNYKALQSVELKTIGPVAVFLGENGVGKSTLFDVFGFMKDCISSNVTSALQRRGGYNEVRSRESKGNIEFTFKYRLDSKSPLCTYFLSIEVGRMGYPVVSRETLSFRRGSGGKPWNFVDYRYGKGDAITNQTMKSNDIKDAVREAFPLKSEDQLAISALGQLQQFPAAAEFRSLIEDWFVSDFQIDSARQMQDISYNDRLSKRGENIANVAQFLKDKHPEKFGAILRKMGERIPGVKTVDATTTLDGQILLKFSDGRFKNPFAARFVSDGTIKMFAYLVMLADPTPHALLCVEEPENQLYPHLLSELVEEFREYANAGGQIFVSTHSPDLVNALEPDELFIIEKNTEGYSVIEPISANSLVVGLFKGGDKLGWLWDSKVFG
jgi:predicted ATPase